MTEYVARGDHRRSMELLWGRFQPPAKGPKQGVSVEDIVRAAIALADEEGLAAVSMRKVGERLGRSAMSLYTYVPSKAELLDLMLDRALGELRTDITLERGWRSAVEEHARDAWAFYERHPWVLQIAGSRALLGPHEMDVFEHQLRLLDGLGLTGAEMASAVAAIASFVSGSAKAVADARTAEQVTGQSDDEWWLARSPLVEEMSADEYPTRYPTLTKLGEQQAFDQLDWPDDDATPYTVRAALDTFEFGLQRLLDGIEAFVEAKRAGRDGAPPQRGSVGRDAGG